jgi:hypothetical protein
LGKAKDLDQAASLAGCIVSRLHRSQAASLAGCIVRGLHGGAKDAAVFDGQVLRAGGTPRAGHGRRASGSGFLQHTQYSTLKSADTKDMLVLSGLGPAMNGGHRAQRSHCRFAPPRIRFTPDSPLFLARRCGRTPSRFTNILGASHPRREVALRPRHAVGLGRTAALHDRSSDSHQNRE